MALFADSNIVWLKNFLIRHYIRLFKVDTTLAENEDLDTYPTFTSFFIRKIKPELRPIASGVNEIASPVDGVVAELGSIKQNQLLQAKNLYYDLDTLLGNEALAEEFYDGEFATFYLSPRDYHRVHMPLDGVLKKTFFIPGKLFSVNRMTSSLIPNLYSRNERFICLFDSPAGPMLIVLVGAIIVGSIQTT